MQKSSWMESTADGGKSREETDTEVCLARSGISKKTCGPVCVVYTI